MSLDANAIQALGPRKAIVDGDAVETHSLKDMIAADKYNRKTGPSILKIRRCKIAQPGPNSRFDPPEC